MSSFEKVIGLKPRKTVFNLSYEKKMTMDMGQLIPVVMDEAVPGDVWSIGNNAVIRFQPLLAPILHRIDVRTYYFFVPNRHLDANWEEFITRGEDGTSEPTLNLWNPQDATTPANVIAEGTLWDYCGFPTGINPPTQVCPLDLPRRAYIQIWNQYFRDQNLQTEVDETDADNYSILNRNFDKTYLTSLLPFQQRGTPPALPVFGTAATEFDIPYRSNTDPSAQVFPSMIYQGTGAGEDMSLLKGSSTSTPSGVEPLASETDFDDYWTILSDNNSIDGLTFTSVDIADFRLAHQLQVFLERNARSGGRYLEQLQSRFGCSPTDQRLQRGEYIGGSSTQCVFSEVLQTSATSSEPTPQGNLAGHGIAVQGTKIGNYRVEEYGVILGLLCVTPKPSYQDGINRQWLRRTNYDFYAPEFANLSEQVVFNAEVCAKDRSADTDGTYGLGTFGYTGMYNEMRYKENMVCGEMRSTYDYWHLGRQFNPASPPTLNSDFVEVDPADTKRIFAVQNEPGLIVSFGNILNVARPMPLIPEPQIGGHS